MSHPKGWNMFPKLFHSDNNKNTEDSECLLEFVWMKSIKYYALTVSGQKKRLDSIYSKEDIF